MGKKLYSLRDLGKNKCKNCHKVYKNIGFVLGFSENVGTKEVGGRGLT